MKTEIEKTLEWSWLALILRKTDGRCHLCGEEHALENYPRSWEVDHSRARAWGGSDRLSNLFVACVSCNRSKGTQDSRSFRRENGLRRSPLSGEKRMEKRVTHALFGAAVGGLGALIFAPEKFWWCFGIGGVAGFAVEPEWNNKKGDELWVSE